ncbi:MAG: RagB/SusD family nutrient uptake outer membrane protein [Bacteroidales bacterium]|nr:RagB/SusD family nutrient uptake outer membrane protein [Bacteroidales bacterium]
MKTKIIFLFLVFTALIGCEDILDTSPKGVLVEGTLASAEAVDKLVIAAYQGLGAHFLGNAEAFAGPSSNWIIDVRSDDAYKGGGGITDRTDIHQLETATIFPDNYATFQKWRNNMFAIARCNLAMREIEKLEDPNYAKEQRIAEMRLLRGHFFFDLKRNFDQIPYFDENDDPTKISNKDYTSDEVWDLIEADFQYAFDNLPLQQPDIGRVNKYIAAAYLAKINIERKEWDAAITHCDFVMGGPYALFSEFENISKVEYENGSEVVFAAQYSTANIYANHNWGNLLNVTLGPGIDNGAYANGDDFYHGSQNLVNAYRTDDNGLPLFNSFDDEVVADGNYSGTLDPRLDHTFGRIGIPWKGTAIYSEAWMRSTDYLGYSSKKHVVAPDHPDIHNSFPWAASGLNFMFIRYAEVLLWKAEALIESDAQQDLNEARTLINQVRERAMNSAYVQKLDGSGDAANYLIGPYPGSGWNQEYARMALRFERRLELAMEGHRFYDLNRWNITAEVMNDYYASEAARVSYLGEATFIEGTHEYLPIPQDEIDLAPELYFQNNGYN